MNADQPGVPEFPPLRSGVLNREDIQTMLEEILENAQVCDVFIRRRAQEMIDDDCMSKLDQALRALREEVPPAVQIRYRWNEAVWIDTITPCPEGFRVVRIQHA
jgi:hypothetical protein